MNKELLQDKVQLFITENENMDAFELSLTFKGFEGVPIKEIAQQIAARKKAKPKLPSWYSAKGIIYPAKLSVEQSSSEITAKYKASLVKAKSFADLTGGMGVDSWALASSLNKGYYIEQNDELATISEHNLKSLGVNNLIFKNQTAEGFLKEVEKPLDLIYIDPARRDGNKNRVFKLQDCTPDLTTLLPELLEKGKSILIKTAPLLDIAQTLDDLKHVCEVHIVSVQNECKEVLYLLKQDSKAEPLIKTINFTSDGKRQELDFTLQDERDAKVEYGELKSYLYEPNSSIMKAGGFKIIATRLGLKKLHPNTHLYTGDSYLKDFPGRIFKISATSNYAKKELKKILDAPKANVATRNFPDNPEKVKKKLGIKDGGSVYLFGCRLFDDRLVIVAGEKV